MPRESAQKPIFKISHTKRISRKSRVAQEPVLARRPLPHGWRAYEGREGESKRKEARAVGAAQQCGAQTAGGPGRRESSQKTIFKIPHTKRISRNSRVAQEPALARRPTHPHRGAYERKGRGPRPCGGAVREYLGTPTRRPARRKPFLFTHTMRAAPARLPTVRRGVDGCSTSHLRSAPGLSSLASIPGRHLGRLLGARDSSRCAEEWARWAPGVLARTSHGPNRGYPPAGDAE